MGSKDTSDSKKPGSDKWVQQFSRSRPGKCYYFNVRTKESSWTRPEGFVEVQGTTSSAPKETNAHRKRKSGDNALLGAEKSETFHSSDGTKRRNNLKAESSVQHKITQVSQSKKPLKEDAPPQINGVSSTGNAQVADLKNADSYLPGKRHDVSQFKGPTSNVAEDGSGVVRSMEISGAPLEIPFTKVGEARRKIKARKKTKHTAPLSGAANPGAAKTYQNVTGIVCDKPAILHSVSSTSKSDGDKHTLRSTKSKLVNGHINALVNDHTKETLKEPAQRRLKRLQNYLKRSLDTKKQSDTPKKDFKLTKSPQKWKSPVVDGPIHSASVIADSVEVRPAERRLANIQSKLKHEQDQQLFNALECQDIESTIFIPVIKEDSDVDAMEIEYVESEVLCDIGEFRLKEFAVEFTEQPTFMDVDADYSMTEFDPQSLCYIVLDTNILLSHLKFVEGLRDSVLPGKGLVHLFLPWQVLHELDHLKDKGKSSIQPLARRAINYLHDNFSSKHPRVRGQKLSEATLNSHSCPDDNILQSCVQLKDQGYDVILLSNDKNLLNKALVCEVSALSKDELLIQLNENSKSCSSDSVISNNPERRIMLGNENTLSPGCRNDTILCEMKTIIKDTLSEVVSRGMEDEYRHLWPKRTIISPPWEADQALHCLCHHWLPLCGDFIRDTVRISIQQLKGFLKMKRYGISDSDLKESLELTKAVFESISKKYIKTVDPGIQKLKALLKRMDNKPPTLDVQESDPNRLTVLLCFQEAHIAAQSLCCSSVVTDPEWRQKAGYMIEAVQTLIRLLTVILSKPPESMSEEDPVLNELVNLIKGQNNITPKDIINFCKEDSNKTLLENGIQQFSTFGVQLTTMLQLNT